MNILKLVAEELKDPLRDYKKFDHGKRARYECTIFTVGWFDFRLFGKISACV